MTPELMDGLANLAVACMSLMMTVVLPIVAAKVQQYTKIKIEEKHLTALHQAAATWAEDAVKMGGKQASKNAGASFKAYALASVPDAMATLLPSAMVLDKIAGRYLTQAEPYTISEILTQE
jgi:hypothetical protein